MNGIRSMARREKKLVIPTTKPRNHIARDVRTNGLYQPKCEPSIKFYKRKAKHKEHYGIE